jgi:cysteinyl-tRNA synthetase
MHDARILEGFFNNAGVVHALDGQIAAPVRDALLDDLNTPRAIAELHALDRPGAQNALGETLKALGFSGTLATPGADGSVDETTVAALIEARLAARKGKNWAESDRIRDELATMGVAIKDNKDGTTSWEVKR